MRRALPWIATCLVLGVWVGAPQPAQAQNTVHDDCDYCHNVHGGGGFVPLTDHKRDVDLCLSCHDDGAPPTYNDEPVPKGVAVHAGADHAAADTTSCVDCHDHEGEAGGNLALIPRQLNSRYTGLKTVVFTARSGANSFADGNTAYDGMCEVCHTQTAQHRADGSAGRHNAAANCTACHRHDTGFQGAGGCTVCHSTPQDSGDGAPLGGRRAVVGEFARASHHVVVTPADSIPDGDCTTCHDMALHQQGSVRLKNADNAGIIYALTGDPATSSTEAAKLTAFCLSCHDANAAGGAEPFGDRQMPPVIDNAFWVASLHEQSAAIVGCYGNGQFGCHATGHGSAKQKLLAPAGTPPTPPANTEEEEGFCYACHDADGPAGTDIHSQFARATRHNVSDNDPGGEFVECTNCHNPHLASAANKLANPDTQAQVPWGGTLEGFCLTCHDGVPPTGIGFPAPTWSGFSKSTFVGTAHDVQSGGTDSCRSCHEQHGSSRRALLKAQYVMTDYNQWSQGDGDYQLCWNCHSEDYIMNQDNAFERLHDRHVRGEDAPCVMCHDVHAPRDAGESLINFDFAAQNGYDIQYIGGRNASTAYWITGGDGFCYIRCHGEDHDPKDYRRQ